MRSLSVRILVFVLSVAAGFGLIPGVTSICSGQYYVVPTYYSSAYYYPTSYYATSYYYPSAYSYSSAYYYPTSYSYYYPSAYYYPSSYYYPTSYYYPSAYYYPSSYYYYPTSYYYPTAYYPSSYYYPTYYSSSYYYPTYYSTGYYYPTGYYYLGQNDRPGRLKDAVSSGTALAAANGNALQRDGARGLVERPLVASYGAVNEPPVYDSPSHAAANAALPASKNTLVKRAGYVQTAGSSRSAGVLPPVVDKVPPAPGSAAPKSSPKKVESTPADASNRGGATPAKNGAAGSTPREESSEPGLEPAPPIDNPPVRRDSLRPRYQPKWVRNVLVGRVESDAGEAREGVLVSVSKRNEPGPAHTGTSNAYGGFAIRLEEGDWTVRVTMPSGRAYPVRQISVKDGRVIDNTESRDIPSLIISY
jgi:hypothetical protein